MFFNSLIKGFALTGLVLASITVNIMPCFSQSRASESRPAGSDQVKFFCSQIHDQASGEKIYATLVWIPETKENRRIVGWKSNYFDKTMTTQKRCETVSQKFQTSYDSGNLQYLTLGQAQGYPIICAVKNVGDSCDKDHQLFTLKPHGNSRETQKDLTAILSGNASGMLMQSSGDQAYIPFADLLKNSPVVN